MVRHGVIALSLWALHAAVANSQVDKPVLARLSSEGVAGWGMLEKLYRATQCVTTQTHTAQTRDTPTTDVKQITIKRKGSQFRIEVDDNEVFAANPRYRFRVNRSSNDAPWLLKHVTETAGQEEYGEHDFDIDVGHSVWSVFSVPLASLIKHPSFHIQKLSADSNGIAELIFTVSPPTKDLSRLAGGRVLMDTNTYWRVQEYDAALRDAGDSEGLHVVTKIDYGENVEGILNLRRVNYSLRWNLKGKPKSIVWEVYYNSCAPCTTSEREFTLRDFGLTEPGEGFTQPRGFGTVSILIGIAFVCFGLAAVLTWFRRRAAS